MKFRDAPIIWLYSWFMVLAWTAQATLEDAIETYDAYKLRP